MRGIAAMCPADVVCGAEHSGVVDNGTPGASLDVGPSIQHRSNHGQQTF